MIRGIRFRIPNAYGRVLADILQSVNCGDYNWKVEDDQIFLDGDNASLFKEKSINGNEFKSIISQKDYYTIFAKIKAFPRENDIKDITKYEDFVNSGCEIMLLIVDSIFVDIYFKKEKIAKKLSKILNRKTLKE